MEDKFILQENLNEEGRRSSLISTEPVIFLDREIGRGGQAVVYLATWQIDTQNVQKVVVKAPLSNNQNSIVQLQLAKELYVLKNLHHPHVLGLLTEVPSKNWLVLPYMQKGSLKDLIKREQERFPWSQRLLIGRDISAGLDYLHQQQIIHRDIKADNVLIDSNYRAKLADFGIAQIQSEQNMTFLGIQIVGTRDYLAPELQPWLYEKRNDTAPYSEASDMYALGTVFWEIASRDTAARGMMMRGYLQISEETPLTYRQWITLCREKLPQKRPKASQVFIALDSQETREKLLGEVNRRLVVTQIQVQQNVEETTTLLTSIQQVPNFLTYLFPVIESQTVLNELIQQLQRQLNLLSETLQKLESMEAVKKWQLNCDCLLKNPEYWQAMTLCQRLQLCRLICQYGYFAHHTTAMEISIEATRYWQETQYYLLSLNSQSMLGTTHHEVQQWFYGFVKVQIFGVLAKHELNKQAWDSAFTHAVAVMQMAPEAMPYFENLLTICWLWRLLKDTLQTQTACHFHDVAKTWLALLIHIKQQFSSSQEELVQATLPLLLRHASDCLNSLIPRVHERFLLLFEDAQKSSDISAQQFLQTEVLAWYQAYCFLEQWPWVEQLHANLIKLCLEPLLIKASHQDSEAFTLQVNQWVTPWLYRYAQTGKLDDLATAACEWVKSLAIEKTSQAKAFDSMTWEQQIKTVKVTEETSEAYQKIFVTPILLWRSFNQQREKIYGNQEILPSPSAYSEQVLKLFQLAFHYCLPFLGEAPEQTPWSLLGLGSLGRQQLFPYSDLDIALLVGKETVRRHEYWQRLYRLCETLTQIMDATGYWEPKEQHYIYLGHHIDRGDQQAWQGKNPVWIQTPQGLSQWVVHSLHLINERDLQKREKTTQQQILAYSCLHAVELAGTGNLLLKDYFKKLKAGLLLRFEHPTMAQAWQQAHGKDWQRSLRVDVEIRQNSINLKHSVFAPLNYYWLDMALQQSLYQIADQLVLAPSTIISTLEIDQNTSEGYYDHQWLVLLQDTWEAMISFRQMLELRVKSRVLNVKTQETQQNHIPQLTPIETQLKLSDSEYLLIERFYGVIAVIYNAVLQYNKPYHPLQAGLPTTESTKFLQAYFFRGLAALVTFDKQGAFLLHRGFYRLLPQRVRLIYDETLRHYQQCGVAPLASVLFTQILSQVPLPNGNRSGFSLREQNWQKTIMQLVTLYQGDIQKLPKETQGVLVRWVHQGKTYQGILKSEFAIQLLDLKGQFKQDQSLPDGRRAVIPLYQENEIIAYPKAYPELPGRQLAADNLCYRITGSSVQASLVLFIPVKNGKLQEKNAYPVLLSKPAGETIQNRIRMQNSEKHQKSTVLEEQPLDLYHFTLKVLVTYLIGYEDDKKDNVTICQGIDLSGKACFQLLSIDSDHVFFSPMVNTTVSSKVQVKSVALMFPAMMQLLDPEAVKDFLSLDRLKVLEEWLADCRFLSNELIGNVKLKKPGLFEPKLIQRLAPLESWFESKQFSFIPLAFEPGTISEIYQRWLRLEQVLQIKRQITHFELLKALSPRFAQIYQQLFQAHATIADRFDALAEQYTDYKITKENQQVSHTSTRSISVSKTLVGTKKFEQALKEGKIFDASGEHASGELDRVQKDYQRLSELKKVVYLGVDLANKEQDGVIETLELLFSKPDYAVLLERLVASLRFKYTLSNTNSLLMFEQKLLALLAKQSWQHLTLVGWRAVNEDWLLKLTANSADLQTLVLIDCPNLQCDGKNLAKLSENCPTLKRLHLSGVKTLSVWSGLALNAPVTFLSLQYLQLVNCQKLKNYQLTAPQLKQLVIKDCPELVQLDLRGQPIQQLYLVRCPELTDGGIWHDLQAQYLQKAKIEDCWFLKFSGVYEKWPWLMGQLDIYYEDIVLQDLIELVSELSTINHFKSHESKLIVLRQIAHWRNNQALKSTVLETALEFIQNLSPWKIFTWEEIADEFTIFYPVLTKTLQNSVFQALLDGMEPTVYVNFIKMTQIANQRKIKTKQDLLDTRKLLVGKSKSMMTERAIKAISCIDQILPFLSQQEVNLFQKKLTELSKKAKIESVSEVMKKEFEGEFLGKITDLNKTHKERYAKLCKAVIKQVNKMNQPTHQVKSTENTRQPKSNKIEKKLEESIYTAGNFLRSDQIAGNDDHDNIEWMGENYSKIVNLLENKSFSNFKKTQRLNEVKEELEIENKVALRLLSWLQEAVENYVDKKDDYQGYLEGKKVETQKETAILVQLYFHAYHREAQFNIFSALSEKLNSEDPYCIHIAAFTLRCLFYSYFSSYYFQSYLKAMKAIMPSEKETREKFKITNHLVLNFNSSFTQETLEIEETLPRTQLPIKYDDLKDHCVQLLRYQLSTVIDESVIETEILQPVDNIQTLAQILLINKLTDKLIFYVVPISLDKKSNALDSNANYWGLLIRIGLPNQMYWSIYQNPLGCAIPDAVANLLKNDTLYDLQIKQSNEKENLASTWLMYNALNLITSLEQYWQLTETVSSKDNLQQCIVPIDDQQGKQLSVFYQNLLKELLMVSVPKPLKESPRLKNLCDPKYWYQSDVLQDILTKRCDQLPELKLAKDKRFLRMGKNEASIFTCDRYPNQDFYVAIGDATDVGNEKARFEDNKGNVNQDVSYGIDFLSLMGAPKDNVIYTVCEALLAHQNFANWDVKLCQEKFFTECQTTHGLQENEIEKMELYKDLNSCQSMQEAQQVLTKAWRAHRVPTVFTEVLPLITANEATVRQARIVLPLNTENRHWISLEIVLFYDPEAKRLKADVWQHDPYGGNGSLNLEKNNKFQQQLKLVLADEMKLLKVDLNQNQSIEIIFKQSPYEPRQQDGSSCGAITIEDVILLAQGETLNGRLFAEGAPGLRQAHQNIYNQLHQNNIQPENQTNQQKEQPTYEENLKNLLKQNRNIYFSIIEIYLKNIKVIDQKVLELLLPAIEQAKKADELFKLKVEGQNLKGQQLIQCYLENYASDEKNELPVAFVKAAEYIRDHLDIQAQKKPVKIEEKQENKEDSSEQFLSIHSGDNRNRNQMNQNLSQQKRNNNEKERVLNQFN